MNFKLKKDKHPSYLIDIISKFLSTRTTWNHNSIPLFNDNMNTSETLFPSTIIEWNKLDDNYRNLKIGLVLLKTKSLNLLDQLLIVSLIKLLTRLRVVLSHLRE